MRASTVPTALAALLAAGTSQAQVLINELSFGAQGRLSPPESPGKIPGFTIQGDPNTPQVLSNKIILTPPSPGNQRGAVWSEELLTRPAWTADVDFRATGPDRGGGNLNIWLVRGGASGVGSRSIYTVGPFDGLALVVDTHGGSGGMVRGFLNDGQVDFSHHHDVDDLAFGHCLYSYRNLGRPSQIKLRQSPDAFRVEVDGRLCFESNKFSIPPGNQIGVSAATPDNPDSFEVFKVTVMSESGMPGYNSDSGSGGGSSGGSSGRWGGMRQQSQPAKTDEELFAEEEPDEDADIFQTSKAQFQDLHNRLQAATHQVSAVYRTSSKHAQMDEQRHAELRGLFEGLQARIAGLDQVSELQKRLGDLEGEVRGMRNDLRKQIQANERSVKGFLTDHHATLSQTLIDSMPGHKRLILVIVGTQGVLVAAYVLYKRRRATSPKKYL